MAYQWIIGFFAGTALSFLVPMAASAEPTWQAHEARANALRWELGYLALSAADAAETIDCLHRELCEEANPLFGKHPSAKTLILSKIGLGLVHFAVFSRMNARNPKAAMRVAQISCAVQGSVVLLNARLTFN